MMSFGYATIAQWQFRVGAFLASASFLGQAHAGNVTWDMAPGIVGAGNGTVTGNTLRLAGTPIVTTGTGLFASIASVIQGTVGLTKSGSGTLTLTGANTYTGTTTVTNGTLSLEGNRTADSGAIFIGNGAAQTGTVNLSNGNFSTGTGDIQIGTVATGSGIMNQTAGPVANDSDYISGLDSATIKAGGGLTKNGLGELILSGINTYQGPTLVSGGRLIITGQTHAASAVTVEAGATLGGSGSVQGPITSPATIAPTATISTGTVDLTDGILAIEVSGASAGRLLSSGAIELSNTDLTISEATPAAAASYVIAEEAGMMEILRYWAPVVYQEVRENTDLGRQLYGARDTFVAMNFDGDWDVANNWHNSRYQPVDQGQLVDRLTPPLHGKSYSGVVESRRFWFLTYGFYHSGQDSYFSAARHQNDWETVVFIIRKNESRYGTFEGMMTQFHTDQFAYLPSEVTFSDHRPIIHIEPNGGVEGHGIKAYTDQNPGSNGAVYIPAASSENVTSTDLTSSGNWNTAPRWRYKLIPVSEMWGLIGETGLNDPYSGWKLYNYARPANHPTCEHEEAGGNPPWDRDFFEEPFVYFSANFPALAPDLAADSYVFNPYLNGASNQSGPNNPNGLLPASTWQKTQLGGTSGYAWTHRGETTLYHRSGSTADDRLTFSHAAASGDFVIQGRVHSVQDITNSRAGLMIRNSTADTSRMIGILVSAQQQVLLQYRTTDGGKLSAVVEGPMPTNDAPVWLRLERKGGDIIASYSYQELGGQFIVLTTVPISMDNEVRTGMAMRSSNAAYYSAATMTNIELQTP